MTVLYRMLLNQTPPALTPLAVTDNTREPQKSGTRSDTAVDSASAAPAINTMCDESSTSYSGAEQLHVVADRLTLGDTPSSEQAVRRTLNDTTSAAEASALPVPLVVAVPILPRLQGAQPESQTPPIPGLPGLIEPTTDEERAEREYHLGFMREALDMVSHSLVFATFIICSSRATMHHTFASHEVSLAVDPVLIITSESIKLMK